MNRKFEFVIDPSNSKKFKKKFWKENVFFKIYRKNSVYNSLRNFFSRGSRKSIEEPDNQIVFPKIKKKDLPLLNEQEE